MEATALHRLFQGFAAVLASIDGAALVADLFASGGDHLFAISSKTSA